MESPADIVVGLLMFDEDPPADSGDLSYLKMVSDLTRFASYAAPPPTDNALDGIASPEVRLAAVLLRTVDQSIDDQTSLTSDAIAPTVATSRGILRPTSVKIY
jgi:hypothetical protein